MNRLPIRVKLALPFAIGMALVVAAMAAFIYFARRGLAARRPPTRACPRSSPRSRTTPEMASR